MNYFKFDNEMSKIDIYESNYSQVLKEIAKFIKELSIKDNIDSYFYIFCYLLYNGYFSVDHKFLYGVPKNENYNFAGINIFEGLGVCRNISPFMNDIFYDELGIDSMLVATFRDEESKNNMPLYLNIDKTRLFTSSNKKSDYAYNHLENLIIINNSIYTYDPTNLLISKSKLCVFNDIKKTLDTVKLCDFNSNIDSKKYQYILKLLKNKKMVYIQNDKKYDYIKQDTLEKCSNKKLLEDFHENFIKVLTK